MNLPPVIRKRRPDPNGPSAWLNKIGLGGPHDIPKSLNPNSVKALTAAGRIKDKQFAVRTNADGTLQVYRIS